MSNQIFHEQQRTIQWWIWSIVVLVTIAYGWSFYRQIILGNPIGKNPAPNEVMYLLLIIPLALIFLLLFLALKTSIDHIGIKIHYRPFLRRHYQWEQIKRIEVIDYNPIREFGGWGIRYGIKKRNKAYTVSGNHGLSVELNDGTRILIGTRKAEELTDFLKVLGKI